MLLHLLKKDFVYLRVWLVFTWATWSLLLLHPSLGAGDIHRNVSWLPIIDAVGWIVALLTLARLIHLDSFVGSNQFLSVRPVSRKLVIGSKLAFIGVMMILPLFCIRVVHIALLSLDLSHSDYLLLIPGLLIPSTAGFFLLLLFAVFTRRTSTTVLALIGAFIIFLLLMIGFGFAKSGAVSTSSIPILPEVVQLNISRIYVGVLVFIGCAAWAVTGFAITRRWVQPILSGVAFLSIAFLGVPYWPINFVYMLSEKYAAVPVAEQPDFAALTLVKNQVVNRGAPTFNNNNENGRQIDMLVARYQVGGLPAPWYSKQKFFHSSARFENGEVINSEGSGSSNVLDNEPFQTIAAGMLGFTSVSKTQGSEYNWTLAQLNVFRVRDDLYVAAKTRSPLVAIDGEATFAIARAKIVHDLPLQQGARVAGCNFRAARRRKTLNTRR